MNDEPEPSAARQVARQLLPPEAAARMAQRFEQVDQETLGEATIFVDLARRICAASGVAFASVAREPWASRDIGTTQV